ncbi:HEAT repeat domain-containing protein, partial [Nostoc sp. CALU 1950]|uniref:HEAT repeat domain-containing protein n=1 Tax=Nostoc sp. CALU 1950 TaxID=3104321 RepID=UPI003EBA6BCF
ESLRKIDPANPTVIEGLITLIRASYSGSDIFMHMRIESTLEEIGVGNQIAIDALISLIHEPQVHNSTRCRAAKILGEIGVGKQTAIDALIAIIRNPQVDSDIRRVAAESL